jgi:hypothetical protein
MRRKHLTVRAVGEVACVGDAEVIEGDVGEVGTSLVREGVVVLVVVGEAVGVGVGFGVVAGGHEAHAGGVYAG